jgi:hypothetical protein
LKTKRQTTAPTEADDRGQAAKARPSVFFSPEGKARGSIATERVEVRRYSDATLYDRMHARAQLSDRQHQAAERLHVLWTEAGLNPCVSMRFDAMQEEIHASDDDGTHVYGSWDGEVGLTTLDAYRRCMRDVPSPFAIRLDAMLMGEHPGMMQLATLQAALEFMAERWGFDGSGIERDAGSYLYPQGWHIQDGHDTAGRSTVPGKRHPRANAQVDGPFGRTVHHSFAGFVRGLAPSTPHGGDYGRDPGNRGDLMGSELRGALVAIRTAFMAVGLKPPAELVLEDEEQVRRFWEIATEGMTIFHGDRPRKGDVVGVLGMTVRVK